MRKLKLMSKLSSGYDDSASPGFLMTLFIKTRAVGIEDVMEAYEKIKVAA